MSKLVKFQRKISSLTWKTIFFSISNIAIVQNILMHITWKIYVTSFGFYMKNFLLYIHNTVYIYIYIKLFIQFSIKDLCHVVPYIYKMKKKTFSNPCFSHTNTTSKKFSFSDVSVKETIYFFSFFLPLVYVIDWSLIQ